MDQLQTIFSEVLSLPVDIDWSGVQYQITEGWDSVAHMAIVAEIEEAFDIMLDVDDILDMSTFDRAVAIVGRYQGST
jgi:acyl carrier protein